MPELARSRLIQCLDTAVIAYIITIYTFDETLFRAVLSFFFHWEIVRPSGGQTSRAGQISTRNGLLFILLNQIVAIAMHCLGNNPETGVDGYLHGSIITSFIGVPPPTKFRLVAGDLTIILLEIFTFITARDPEYEPGEQANILQPSEAIDSISGYYLDTIDPRKAINSLLAPLAPLPSTQSSASSAHEAGIQPEQAQNSPIDAYLGTMVI